MTATVQEENMPHDIRVGMVRATTYGLFSPPELFVPQARALGAGIVRVNIYWSQVEPEPGRFVWDAVDALLDQLGEGDEAWVTVCASSPWATRRGTRWLPASPALEIGRYRRFVTELVGRRPGAIRFWQCEIEPCLPLFWAGTAEEYLTQLGAFHTAAKGADPAALVVLGGAVPGAMLGDGQAGAGTWAAFFGQVLRDGSEYFDVFDIHPYGDAYEVPALIEACRTQLAAHGCRQLVVASEHSGPLPTDFPENLPYLAEALAAHQRQFLGEVPMPDTIEDLQATEEHTVVALYERRDELPPALQMFLADCPADLESERHRIACTDLVVRTVLALAAGVRRNLYYALGPEWKLKRHLRITPILMFGKLALMDYTGDAIAHRYPAADTFALMTRHLDQVARVDRITVPDRPDIYLFEVRRTRRTPLLIAWRRPASAHRDDRPPTELVWEWPHPHARAVDALGTSTPVELHDGEIKISVSSTPVFIDTTLH
ncbi:hypothetical protein [Amycolatopsis regifaucium]|uniref:Glycoside hydrolase family 42 N-terminal domain-containing protein n=1 Tax=Amycolatopsis regifaucium TaxID=546365 RepID=A0A154M3K8_9PSEU|nr:hypothetical protein [Amycolatopsis regifaucium]KZB79178.1 hypothetical protein AVL48_16365 [Amycolatopsis regifaucium]OKA07361.1 hypothetical protein ATP06_0216050 [Amycolatopsis regifaucium]SFH13459.1 hypothetical protein SAMN04489731_102604 [Amycolatopsis regifaucium]